MVMLGIERVGKWIKFRHTGTSFSGKTHYWNVEEKDSDSVLGEVKWFGGWRRYCFFPNEGSFYEQDCLREIADFCEEFSKAHKKECECRSVPSATTAASSS